MKIGFDVSQTGNSKAGCGFFAENLIRNLAALDNDNEYVLYPTFGDHFWDDEAFNTCNIEQKNFSRGLTHSNINVAKNFWQSPSALLKKMLGNVDIIHANNFYCPPKLDGTKIIYTLHDLSFLEVPDCNTEHNRIACLDGVFKASLNADCIIAVSNYTRQHFLKTFPHYPQERISVVHLASRFADQPKVLLQPKKCPSLIPQQYWLNVGTIEPRKNIKRLIQAYAKLRTLEPTTFPLVLAGKNGWMEDDIFTLIQNLNLEQHVHLTGYLQNDELQWLYQNCFCLVYPSLFEGFGLPVLEALSFGKPVITSNSSSLPEVIGKAGLMINPLNEEDLLQAMINISTQDDYRNELKSLAFEQAKLFSWKNSAKKVLDLYQNVVTLSN